MRTKTCEYCQDEFIPARKDTRYCSKSCKQMAYLERKEDDEDTNVNTEEENELETSKAVNIRQYQEVEEEECNDEYMEEEEDSDEMNEEIAVKEASKNIRRWVYELISQNHCDISLADIDELMNEITSFMQYEGRYLPTGSSFKKAIHVIRKKLIDLFARAQVKGLEIFVLVIDEEKEQELTDLLTDIDR